MWREVLWAVCELPVAVRRDEITSQHVKKTVQLTDNNVQDRETHDQSAVPAFDRFERNKCLTTRQTFHISTVLVYRRFSQRRH